MVANTGFINSNVEATAYISAVAAFAAIVLVVLLFLGRRWCHSTAFNRKCRDDILPVNPRVTAEPGSPLDNAQFDALSKPKHYPDRIYTYEASDSDDELRLRIQDKEDVECHYEEKNENVSPSTKLDVELVETALRETSLRETNLRETSLRDTNLRETNLRETNLRETSLRDTSIRESRIDQDTSLLCADGGSGQERGAVELTLLYDAPVRSMTVHVLQARGLQQKNPPQILQSQVRVVLLPLKKQKFKSKIRNGENPQYMESFVLHKINPAPDTYVKLCLISSLGMEMGRCKSTTRRAQSNPLYKELFIFQVALFQLSEVTLMVSVWWRRSVKRNEMVGWFSLGHSSSGRDEQHVVIRMRLGAHKPVR
ncbi:Uncharacterized protein OBRU01_04617 [Operophtera brumata]|uniref:C2 domain-containing protein n=1 Tax=Operophtera brumata TaxID=104452 RepID=A0A0L7LLA2_OPEBR|nr:Uncharacterized protein OBRU01_04617 [Operophtera brumata]